MRLLLIEDDDDLREALKRDLAGAGYVTDEAAEGETGLHLAETGDYGAIVLDLGLPVLDGLTVLKTLRSAGSLTPVLILTARGRWRERVTGLRAGADDYLAKPFEIEELRARLEALIRRSARLAQPLLNIGEIEIDLSARRVTREGRELSLTPKEYRTLAFLALNRGRVLSKAELGDHVYAEDIDRDPNVIEVTVARLRKKIGRDMIETRRGHGYVIA
ncbi:MAG: response regulator transcription factor [Pseudomonadota bacterium]